MWSTHPRPLVFSKGIEGPVNENIGAKPSTWRWIIGFPINNTTQMFMDQFIQFIPKLFQSTLKVLNAL